MAIYATHPVFYPVTPIIYTKKCVSLYLYVINQYKVMPGSSA
jgi:hypothetical protein